MVPLVVVSRYAFLNRMQRADKNVYTFPLSTDGSASVWRARGSAYWQQFLRFLKLIFFVSWITTPPADTRVKPLWARITLVGLGWAAGIAVLGVIVAAIANAAAGDSPPSPSASSSPATSPPPPSSDPGGDGSGNGDTAPDGSECVCSNCACQANGRCNCPFDDSCGVTPCYNPGGGHIPGGCPHCGWG